MMILVPFKPVVIVFGFIAALMLFCYFGTALVEGKTPSPRTERLRTASLLGSRRRTLRRSINTFTNPIRPSPIRKAAPAEFRVAALRRAQLLFWRVA